MAWVITGDNICDTAAGEKSRVDYGEDDSRVSAHAAMLGFTSEPLPKHPDGNRVPFRLRDEDNEIHYIGVLDDDEDCINQQAALMFGESDTGACIIEVLRGNEWVMEIG